MSSSSSSTSTYSSCTCVAVAATAHAHHTAAVEASASTANASPLPVPVPVTVPVPLRFSQSGLPLHHRQAEVYSQQEKQWLTLFQQYPDLNYKQSQRYIAHNNGIVLSNDLFAVISCPVEVSIQEMSQQDLLRNLRDYPLEVDEDEPSSSQSQSQSHATVERAPVAAEADDDTKREHAMLATDDALIPEEQQNDKAIRTRFKQIMHRRKQRQEQQQQQKQNSPFRRVHPFVCTTATPLTSPPFTTENPCFYGDYDGPDGEFCGLGCFTPAQVTTQTSDASLLPLVCSVPHVCPIFDTCSCVLLQAPTPLPQLEAQQALDQIIITHNTWKCVFMYPFAHRTVVTYHSATGHGFTRGAAIRLICATFCSIVSDPSIYVTAADALSRALCSVSVTGGPCPYYSISPSSQPLERVRVLSIYKPRYGRGQPQCGDGSLPQVGGHVPNEEYDDDWNVKLETDENTIYQIRYQIDTHTPTPTPTPTPGQQNEQAQAH